MPPARSAAAFSLCGGQPSRFGDDGVRGQRESAREWELLSRNCSYNCTKVNAWPLLLPVRQNYWDLVDRQTPLFTRLVILYWTIHYPRGFERVFPFWIFRTMKKSKCAQKCWTRVRQGNMSARLKLMLDTVEHYSTCVNTFSSVSTVKSLM